MPVSNEYFICPFCGKEHNKYEFLGTSGLVCTNGYTKGFECKGCGNYFNVEMEVKLKFKTKKGR